MLIKEADDRSEELARLQQRAESAAGPQARWLKASLAKRNAGQRGEGESAYLINFDYGSSPNWAVLHDLRLEHGGRSAQIDHLLINRWMEFFVLETKHFGAGVKITEDGEFLRWNSYRKTFEGMASPLQQNERHIAVLADVIATIELPNRLGLRISPTYHSLVLVASHARIDRPKRFDTSRVIKADQLKPRIWRQVDADNPVAFLLKSAAKLVSCETTEYVGRQLADRHAPVRRTDSAAASVTTGEGQGASGDRRGRIEPSMPQPVAAQASEPRKAPADAASAGPTCKACGAFGGRILYGKYGYYFKCDGCSTNTAIRFTCEPGHAPRLRKQQDQFFRDCKECGSSTLFHANPPGGAA